ncbi:MAG: ABC transporter permease [Oscillospiraceae bacterium]|jgi:ABC-2 type transport system permease protein|nr:ABC transporter permease [Oscillospiraceae bacterium]
MSVVLDSMRVQMKQTFARNMYRYCMLVSPLLTTIILAEMFKNASHADFLSYVILGSGLNSLWGCICFSSAGDINRERYSNTLSLVFVSPSDFRLILLGKIIGNTILSLGSFALTFVYAIILYRPVIAIANLPLFLFAFLMTILCFVVVSIFVAYLLTLSRRTTLFMNCLDIPLTLICGFVFPVELLPVPVQWIASALPPTWAVRILRQGVSGEMAGFWFNTLMLVLITAAFGLLSSALYQTIMRRVKINATLEMA